jgi:hypothetical protein
MSNGKFISNQLGGSRTSVVANVELHCKTVFVLVDYEYEGSGSWSEFNGGEAGSDSNGSCH